MSKWEYDGKYDDGDHYRCPFCGVVWNLNEGGPEDNEMNFCPKCGHDMREDNPNVD